MKNVIKFPVPTRPRPAVHQADKAGPVDDSRGNPLLKGLWVLTVLLWPLLKYVVILDCVFQFFRMLWFWNTPGTFAGFNFIFHFAILVALTWFVSCYQPKGL